MVGAIAVAAGPSFAIGLNAALGLITVGLVALLMPSLRQRMTSEQEEEQPQPMPAPETARQKIRAAD